MISTQSVQEGPAGKQVLREDLTHPPRDVIFTFSYVTWVGAWRRGMNFAQDRLVQTLLTHPRVGRLVIANPYRSFPVYAIRSALGHDSVPFPTDPRVRLHQPLRLRRRDPCGIRALERVYAAYDRSLHRVARRQGLERPVIISMHPMISGFAPLEWADAVTFYVSDDWSAAPAYRKWWPAYEHAYKRIRERGRRVCAVSQPIIDRLAPAGPHVVVPNGVHPDEWMHIGPPPGWLEGLPRPLMLYIGTLDGRLDVARIVRIARSFPQGTVVLVGHEADPDHLRPLRDIRNVHVHPPIARSDVARVVAAADVCLIPHRDTRFTSAMSPLKVYEYLAGGRPVVATDLLPMRGIDPRVLLVPDGSDFSPAIRKALDLRAAGEEERQQFMARNSWRARHEQVLDLALR